MDTMGTVLVDAILFDSSFVSQNLSETPKPPDLLTGQTLPLPVAHPGSSKLYILKMQKVS